MSLKTCVRYKKCKKLNRVIFSHICLKISGNCSKVFSFLSARDLKQNCKPTVSKVKKTSLDPGEEGAVALLIPNMEGEGCVFCGGQGAYFEDL